MLVLQALLQTLHGPLAFLLPPMEPSTGPNCLNPDRRSSRLWLHFLRGYHPSQGWILSNWRMREHGALPNTPIPSTNGSSLLTTTGSTQLPPFKCSIPRRLMLPLGSHNWNPEARGMTHTPYLLCLRLSLLIVTHLILITQYHYLP